MSLPTIYTVTIKPNYKIDPVTYSSDLFSDISNYIKAVDENNNSDIRKYRDNIKKCLKSEKFTGYRFYELVLSYDTNLETSAINETDSNTINAVKGRYTLFSTVNFYQSINAVSVDMSSDSVDIKLLSLSQPTRNPDATTRENSLSYPTDTSSEAKDAGGTSGTSQTSTSSTPTNGSYNGSNVTSAQKGQADVNRQHEALDDIGKQISGANIHTTGELDEKEYVEYLCPYANTQARNEGKTPQIPTSCIVGIALAITGCDLSKMAKFNFWGLGIEAKISSKNYANANNLYEFDDAYQGINAILEFCRKDEFKDAVANLKEKMSESTQEDKEAFRAALLTKMSAFMAVGDGGWIPAATQFIAKYNLYEWDTDKTEAEGGHADTKPPVMSEGKTGNGVHDKINKAISSGSTDPNKGNKGDNIEIQVLNPNAHVINNDGKIKVIKLPKNITMVEPIYPDYITVGDSVPEWIYSQAYVEAYKAAEEKVLKEAGFSLENDESSKKLAAVNKAIEDFKEQQFKAWCVANNKPYGTDAERAASMKEYNETGATDSTHFTDGIYTPDATSKSTYTSLKQQKASASYDSQNAATAKSHLRYTNDLQSVKSEIQAREGNWNQETGKYTPSQQNEITMYTGGTSNSPSFVNNDGTPSTGVEKMVKWAISIAEDSSHGYSQASRTGNPDYDCSSLVYYALEQAGFGVITNRGYAGNGDTLWEDLQAIGGWQQLSFSADAVKRGDILYRETHVAIATSATEEVAAHGVSFGEPAPGDQGSEISVGTRGNNYTKIFRYTATS